MEIRKRKYKFVSFCLALIMLLNITPLSVLADVVKIKFLDLQEGATINPGVYFNESGSYIFIFRFVNFSDMSVYKKDKNYDQDPSYSGDGYMILSPENIFGNQFPADNYENYWVVFNINTDTTTNIHTVELIVPLKYNTVNIFTEKVYDGNTDVPKTSIFFYKENGDSIPIDISGAKFADKNVGDDKPLTLTNAQITLTELELPDEGQPTKIGSLIISAKHAISRINDDGVVVATGDITPKAVTVSGVTAKDKEYDGNTDAELNVTVNGIINNEEVSAAATGTFVDKTVDKNKTVNINDWHLIGDDNDKKNYTLSNEDLPASVTAAITPKEVTVSGITAINKIYDGNTDAALVYDNVKIDGVINNEKVSVTATGIFEDKAVGTGKTVQISGLTLDGEDSGNYKLAETGQQTDTKADITPKAVTVSGITANDKIYDGNITAELDYDSVTIPEKISDDDLSVTATGAFVDKDGKAGKTVGTDKTVQISGLTLYGEDSGNYKLAETGQQTKATASITRAAVTVSGITANDKQYDGTTAATLDDSKMTITGIKGDDDLSATVVGAFENAEIGDNKTVKLDLTLTGTDNGNYMFSENSQTTTTASITKDESSTDPEPLNPEPVNPEPENPDPVNPEPVNPDPENPDPVNPEPVNPEPENPDPENPEPVNPEPVNPEPENPDPVNPDPVNPEPVDPGEMIKLPVKFQHYNQNGEHGVPADAKAGTWDLTLEVSSADGGTLKTNAKMEVDPKTAAEGKFTKAVFYFTKDIDLTKSKELTVSPKEVEADIYSAENAPVKVYTIQIESVSVDSNNELNVLVKWSDKNANGNDGSGKTDEVKIRVVALPEDEIGAYKLLADGTKEYLLFHTYAICMDWLGNAELCSGYERCFHK